MGVQAITTKDEFDSLLVKKTDNLVVVDFYATWCGPCKQISPKVEAMSKEFASVVFCKVDVDEVEDVATEYNISAMPTFLFFKGGKKVETVVGASEEKVKQAIMKYQ